MLRRKSGTDARLISMSRELHGESEFEVENKSNSNRPLDSLSIRHASSSLVSSLSVRSRAVLEVSTRLGDILDAVDLEFGFSRIDFPPKGSKTQSFCVILAKTSFFKLPVGIPAVSWAL